MLRGDNEMITDDRCYIILKLLKRSSGFKPEKIVCHNVNFDKRIILHNFLTLKLVKLASESFTLVVMTTFLTNFVNPPPI